MLQYCFCFMFWCFWLGGKWDHSSLTRDWTHTPYTLEGEVLTTGIPRKCPFHPFLTCDFPHNVLHSFGFGHRRGFPLVNVQIPLDRVNPQKIKLFWKVHPIFKVMSQERIWDIGWEGGTLGWRAGKKSGIRSMDAQPWDTSSLVLIYAWLSPFALHVKLSQHC